MVGELRRASYIYIAYVFGITAGHIWKKLERFSDYQPTTNQIYSMETTGIIHCLALCQQNNLCKSAYFNNDTGLCTGLDVDPDHPLGMKNSGIALSFYRQVPAGCLQAEYEWVSSINFCFSHKLSSSLNVADAKIFCGGEGGQLVSLNTDEKFDFIREYDLKGFAGNFHSLLVGGSQNSLDSKWYWETGELIDMTRFCQNEPSGGAPCLVIACNASPWCNGITNRLDDVPCSVKTKFICERIV